MKMVSRFIRSAAVTCRRRKLAVRLKKQMEGRTSAQSVSDGFEWLVEFGQDALEMGDHKSAMGYFEWVLARKPECTESRLGMDQIRGIAG